LVLINPEIIYKSKEMRTTNEGCLSFPGLEMDIRRPRDVRVKYTDIDGKECEIEASNNLLAVCL
jgi:peptide deformylase